MSILNLLGNKVIEQVNFIRPYREEALRSFRCDIRLRSVDNEYCRSEKSEKKLFSRESTG